MKKTTFALVTVGALLSSGIGAPAALGVTDTESAGESTHIVDLSPQVETPNNVRSIPEIKLDATKALTSTTNGAETTVKFSLPAGTYKDAAGATVNYAAKATWTCHLRANYPHYSKNNKGVIAKAQVNCIGSHGTLPIRVYQILGRNTKKSTSGMKFVRTSNYIQNVMANRGWSNPWYVPRSGAGAARGAYFRNGASASVMTPLKGTNIASHASPIIWVK